MPTEPKALLSKISKEHKIRFGNNHNHAMLIIQKSVLLLIWEQHYQLAFVTIVQYVIHNCLSFAANKQRNNLALSVSVPLSAL